MHKSAREVSLRQLPYFVCIVLIYCMIAHTNCSPFIPLKPTFFGAYQVSLAYGNGSNMIGPTTFITYSFTPIDLITDILEYSTVLSNFNYNVKDQFNYRISGPSYNGSFSMGLMILAPCNFVYLRFFVLYSTIQAQNFLQINKRSFNPSTVSGAVGTSKTEVLTFTSRLNVALNDTIKVFSVLTSIIIKNIEGATTSRMKFDLNTPSPTVTGTSVAITVSTVAKIIQISITTIIMKKNLIPEQYKYYAFSNFDVDGSVGITSGLGACSMNFNIPGSYGPQFSRNCSIGISGMDDNYALTIPRILDFNSAIAAGFSSCTNSDTSASHIYYGILCFVFAYCPSTTDYYNATSDNCNPCNLNLNGNCTTCNRTTCLTCGIGFYPIGINCSVCTQTNCTLCLTATTCGQCTNSSYVNNSVCISCTNQYNCLFCIGNTTCIKCITGFVPDPTGNCTQCSNFLVNCLSCNDIYTCTLCNTSYYVTGTNNCMLCGSTITNCKTCTSGPLACTLCNNGFYLASPTSCIFCGIGMPHCAMCTNGTACAYCELGYYLANTTSCSSCTSLIGCFNCTSAITCVDCLSGYYLLGSSTCQLCADRHCINCPNATSCLACNPEFTLVGNTSCTCSIGFQVTDICINVIGCVTAVKIANISTCIFCNSMNHFILSNTTCICKTGYKLIGGISCVTKCGDGLIYGLQYCDDGNVNDGDGCSSQCMIEPGYNCSTTAAGYRCIYTANFTISLQYILRQQTSNSASYFFKISPKSPNFANMNKSYYQLNLPSTNYHTTGIQYTDGIIKANVEFTQDIENLPATLTINFDPNYFVSTNMSYSFQSTGTNAPLVVGSYSSHIQYLKIICYILLALAGIILLMSVALQKMIGIETINAFQIIVFSKLLYVSNDLMIGSNLSSLKYIAGFSQVGEDLSETHTLPISYRRLNYNNDFLLNFQTGLFLMGLSIFIILAYMFYRWRALKNFKTNRQNYDQYRLVQQRLDSRVKFIYQRIFFMIACVNLFQAFAAIRIQSRVVDGETQFNYFIVNLLTMVFSVCYIFSILTYEILQVGKAHEWIAPFCQYSPYYISYYVGYILTITPVLVSGEIFLGAAAIYICGGIVFIHFVIILLWRPYTTKIHNFSILFNQVIVMSFLGFEALMKLQNIDESIEFIVSYVMLALIMVIEGLAIVRLYFAFKPAKKEVQRTLKNQVSKMESESKKAMEAIQKDFIVKNKKRKTVQPYGNGKVQDDALIRLKSRLKQEYKECHMNQFQQI